MKIAILTSGILPVPAVLGGAVENLIDFYLDYNNRYQIHDITVYSVYHKDVKKHPALNSKVNHYAYINVDCWSAKVKRYLYHLCHKNEYYNHFIEFFFEQCYKKLSKKNFDIILLENRPGYAYKLSKRGYTNIQLHLHNDLLNETTPYANEIFQSLSKIVTVSNFIKERVFSISQINKVQTVYNGIDLSIFSKEYRNHINRSKLGIKENDFVIIYSGRINSDKGISELIDAIILLQDVPQIKLLVIGSPFFGNASEDDFTRNLKKKSEIIKQNIYFTGYIPYSEMSDYLNLADVAVIPSIWDDPFPTTVLEAQAMALPLIVTNRGGILEEIGTDNAIIVPTGPQFALRLSQAILHLFNNPEQRIAMGILSLSNSKKFSKDRFSKDILNIITE
jgi:glycosyltransferase involved in cell wall biosynthesis